MQFILEESGMKIPKMEYEIYYPLNQSTLIKLNLTTCIGTKVDISVKVSINDSLDKYNSSSDYYNDICTKAKSEGNIDITINDRRNQYKENNMSLCEENCNLVDYDYENEKAKCSCDVKLSIPLLDDIKFNKKDLYKSFINIKNMINLNVMKCFKEVFNKKSLKNNYGFFIVLLIILFYIICLFIFRFKSYIKLLTIISEIVFSLKAKNFEEKICEEKVEKIVEKNEKIIEHKKTKNKKRKRKSKKIKKQNSFGVKLVEKKIDDDNKDKEIKIIAQDKSSNIVMTNRDENKKLDNILKLKYFELNLLNYKEAKESDKRTYLEYYFQLLKINHLIIFSFFSFNDYNSGIIKIFLFFFIFNVHFTVNTLFFNDDTMHKIYEDKGDYNFIYQIPQIIYSSLISALINVGIKLLALSQKNIVKLKQEKKKENLDKNHKGLLTTLKIKFISFFIITFLLLLFFCYYITCFCGIYENTQIHLITDTFISFITSFIYPFIICLVPGIFRIISLRAEKNNYEFMYIISKFLQLF